MRVLIISLAILARATAAPSGAVIAPIPTAVIAPAPAAVITPVPAAVVASIPVNEIVSVPQPTLSPGDLEAAAIDFKVKEEDSSISAADQARILADQERVLADQTKEQAEVNNEVAKEKLIEGETEAKERSLEAFWADRELKWREFDALKTTEAQIDGAVASDAQALARDALVSYVGVIPGSPVVAPLVALSPSGAAVVKSAEIKPEAKPETEKTESVQTAEVTEKKVESQAVVKVDLSKFLDNRVVLTQTPVAFAPGLKLADPWLTTPLAYYQPGFVSTSTVQQLYAPAGTVPATFYQTQFIK